MFSERPGLDSLVVTGDNCFGCELCIAYNVLTTVTVVRNMACKLPWSRNNMLLKPIMPMLHGSKNGPINAEHYAEITLVNVDS